MPPTSQKTRESLFAYLDTPPKQRELSVVDFRKLHRLNPTQYKKVKKEWEDIKSREVASQLGSDLALTDVEWEQVYQTLYRKAVSGDVRAMELFAKLKGKLVEKRETKVGLDDDTYYRIRNKAAQRVDTGRGSKTSRDREVHSESSLLLETPRLPTEQGNEQDS